MDCHGTCEQCQAEKAAMASSRRVEDQAGHVRYVRERYPTMTREAVLAERQRRREKAKAARKARRAQRKRR